MNLAIPTAKEARTHPVLWAIYASGVTQVEGIEAELLSVPDGTVVPRWRTARHLWHLGDLLMDLHSRKERRLIVTLPPRHGKSMLCSRFFAGWWMGRHPDQEIIIASYGDRLTRGWSRKIRDDLVAHGDDVFGVSAVARASTAEWQPLVSGKLSEGNLLATSVGGTATGKGAHLLICDDLFKGVAEARSKSLRDAVWEWLMDEALTRLAPGGVVLQIGTRWHPDDHLGRLLEAQRRNVEGAALPWRLVKLPALAEDDDAIGRKPGEALWPERFPREALEQIRDDGRDPRSWDGLYQCRPAAIGGEFFKQKWLRYWILDGGAAVLPNGDKLDLDKLHTFVVADLAVSKKERADYSVITAWGFDPARGSELLMLDLDRERMDGPDMLPRIQAMQTRWGASMSYIEKTIYHSALIQQGRREGMIIKELKPDTDKQTRALPAAGLMEGGQLLLRGGARWLPVLEDELLSFPDAAHDDQVDNVSYAAWLWSQAYGGKKGRAAAAANKKREKGSWHIGRR